jgi:hypothetical protein
MSLRLVYTSTYPAHVRKQNTAIRSFASQCLDVMVTFEDSSQQAPYALGYFLSLDAVAFDAAVAGEIVRKSSPLRLYGLGIAAGEVLGREGDEALVAFVHALANGEVGVVEIECLIMKATRGGGGRHE